MLNLFSLPNPPRPHSPLRRRAWGNGAASGPRLKNSPKAVVHRPWWACWWAFRGLLEGWAVGGMLRGKSLELWKQMVGPKGDTGPVDSDVLSRNLLPVDLGANRSALAVAAGAFHSCDRAEWTRGGCGPKQFYKILWIRRRFRGGGLQYASVHHGGICRGSCERCHPR